MFSRNKIVVYNGIIMEYSTLKNSFFGDIQDDEIRNATKEEIEHYRKYNK